MTIHIGFVELCMTVTDDGDISNQATEVKMAMHIGFVELCMAVTADVKIAGILKIAIINGMAKPEHDKGADNSDDASQVIKTLERECGISPDVIKNNIDTMQPIGRPDEYGKQLRIVKFTTNSFKEMVFRKHKHHRKSYIEKQNILVSRCRLR